MTADPANTMARVTITWIVNGHQSGTEECMVDLGKVIAEDAPREAIKQRLQDFYTLLHLGHFVSVKLNDECDHCRTYVGPGGGRCSFHPRVEEPPR